MAQSHIGIAAPERLPRQGNGAPAPVRFPRIPHRIRTAFRIVQIRLRFLVVLVIAFVIVGKWDLLRNYWDRLTRIAGGAAPQAASTDTEYFCPMCPGVLSDWPSKCPVCNMALVRRKKGDMGPLPDGIISRMQFSPYRVQLAGIRTSPVGFHELYRPGEQAKDLVAARQAAVREWRDRLTLDLLRSSLQGGGVAGGIDPLIRAAGMEMLNRRGSILAIPETAIVDTGTRQVVYVESSPGTFDGVEVTLGMRRGELYPVLSGLEPGQQVATAGTFLLDAETRLNPAVAAGYFGASRGGTDNAIQVEQARGDGRPAHALDPDALASLSPADRELVTRQRTCPVTGQLLGSMGMPFRVQVEGKTIFLCCEGCEAPLKRRPAKYLSQKSG